MLTNDGAETKAEMRAMLSRDNSCRIPKTQMPEAAWPALDPANPGISERREREKRGNNKKKKKKKERKKRKAAKNIHKWKKRRRQEKRTRKKR